MWSYYGLLFILFTVTGESIVIPAIFASLIGKLDLKVVITLAILASLVSDTFWYCVGQIVPTQKIEQHRLFRKKQKLFERSKLAFAEYGWVVVILSKFVYGTRTIVQILAGSMRMRYLTFISSNLIGVTLWTLCILGLGMGVHEYLVDLPLSPPMFLSLFALTFVILVGLLLWLTHKIIKKLFP